MTAGGTQTTTTAEQLWDALQDARAGGLPRTQANVEDALFRHYLPMACSMAARHTPDRRDPEDLRQAAEVGLAQAILGWRNPGPAGFDRFARRTIADQLRRYTTHIRGDRHPGPDRTAPSPGRASEIGLWTRPTVSPTPSPTTIGGKGS